MNTIDENYRQRQLLLKALEKTNNNSHNRALIKEYVSLLTDQSENNADISDQLTAIIQELNKCVIQNDLERLTKVVLFSENISKGLRIYTQQNNALHFYYYGQFQANVNNFKKILYTEKENDAWMKLLKRKNVKRILEALYELKECQQCELSTIVEIDTGNLSRTMRKLIDAELVEETKLKTYCYYSLTPKAKLFYIKIKTYPANTKENHPHRWNTSKPITNNTIEESESSFVTYSLTKNSEDITLKEVEVNLNEWKSCIINKSNKRLQWG